MSIETISFTIIPCEECVYEERRGANKFCSLNNANIGWHGCGYGQEKQQTNADRIRQMTDEELAKWIELHESTAWCPFDPISDKEVDPVTRECLHHDACWMCVLDWLKSPVEEGEG